MYLRARTLPARCAAVALALLAARTVATGLAARHRPSPAPNVPAPNVPAPNVPAPSVRRPESARLPHHPPGPRVAPGQRAVRIEVEPDWRLPAGSVVDVLAPPEPGPFGDEATRPARVVAAGAVVLPEPSPTGRRRAERAGIGPTVTLLVTLEGARLVAAAAAAGPLSLALAPPEDACCRRSSSGSSRD